jgi:hypothetical protein
VRPYFNYLPGPGDATASAGEWQEALNANGELQERFVELQRSRELRKLGVSGDEQAALDEIRGGQMDMHLRMAQQQAAQRAVAEGNAGDPDPLVFPGQEVQKLSDYVRIMKRMQAGDFMGAIAEYGLGMMSYSSVATAWGAKFAADPSRKREVLAHDGELSGAFSFHASHDSRLRRR